MPGSAGRSFPDRHACTLGEWMGPQDPFDGVVHGLRILAVEIDDRVLRPGRLAIECAEVAKSDLQLVREARDIVFLVDGRRERLAIKADEKGLLGRDSVTPRSGLPADDA